MALQIQYTYGITGHWTQKYKYNNTTVVQQVIEYNKWALTLFKKQKQKTKWALT